MNTPTFTPGARVRVRAETADQPDVFIHTTPRNTCDHEFTGWREFEDGLGGEQVCRKCGLGAMAHTLREGW